MSISDKKKVADTSVSLRSEAADRSVKYSDGDAVISTNPLASNGSDDGAISPDTGSPENEPLQPDIMTSPKDSNASSSVRASIPISEAHADFIYNQSITDPTDGTTKSVREVLETEDIDDSWSYFMEQSLRLFTSSHTEASKFSVFHIECRSSMCEIQAIGFNDSTAPDWSRILYDMEQQPWYNFGQVGTSSSDFQGQLAILTRMYRKLSAPEGE